MSESYIDYLMDEARTVLPDFNRASVRAIGSWSDGLSPLALIEELLADAYEHGYDDGLHAERL